MRVIKRASQSAENVTSYASALTLSFILLLCGCTHTPPLRNESPPVPVSNHTPQPPTTDTDNDSHEDTINIPERNEEPLPKIPQSLGEEVAVRAIALVGKPYRYGGADLDGFDCSGLVFYIYHELGVEVPRTAAEQHHIAAVVSRDELQPGDLLFFRIKRKRISHVGIYVGDNRFVHAPQSGKRIQLRSLTEKYYARHWVSAGRLK